MGTRHYDEVVRKDFERTVQRGRRKAVMRVVGLILLVLALLLQIIPLVVVGIILLVLSKDLGYTRAIVEATLCRKPGFFFQNV